MPKLEKNSIVRAWRIWLLAVLLALGALRLAYVCGKLFWGCAAADQVRVLQFVVVAAIIALAPGLFLRRWLGIRTSNPFLDLVQIMVGSLCCSALLAWLAYAAGMYVRAGLWIGLVGVVGMGVYGLWGVIFPLARFPERLAKFGRFTLGEWMALWIFAIFVLGVFERAVGTPMVSWDALVSWDKWAADAGVRCGLGRYALGGYPQLLPSLGSLFYKLAGSGAAVFPMEYLLLHGFYVVFLGILVLAVLALGRTLGFPGGFVLCLFFGNRLTFEMAVVQIGSVDIPFAALLCAACAWGAAYVQGSWSASGGTRRVALALFFPLFAVAFIKGNGLVWLLVLVVAMGMALRSKAKFRPVALAFGAVAILSLGYLLHQAWFGAWCWESSELSPFLRSHTFVLAHTREFVLSWAHFLSWVERLGGAYGVTSRWGAGGLLVLTMGICLWGVRDRKWRFFSVTGPLGMAIWFLTGSYDFRNAAAAWAMVMVAATGVLWEATSSNRGHVKRWMARSVLVAATAWCGFHLARLSSLPLPVGKESVFMDRPTEKRSLWILPLKPYDVPRIAMLPENRRHMGVRPWGDIREILFNAPFGRRALHLLAADGLYRVLAPKGVYMMHKTRYNDQRRYDVALGEPYLKPPPDYEKVVRFRRVRPYDVPLRLFRPEFRKVEMRAIDLPGADLRDRLLHPGESVQIEFGPCESHDRELKEGILSLRISPPDSQVQLRLSDDDARRDPYAAYFESVKQGDCVRLLYWMADDMPMLPRFVLSAGTNAVRITAAQWGR